MAQTYITLENLTRYNSKVKETYATIADVSDKDTKVVHLDGEETITGLKTFEQAIVGDLTGTAAKATADGDGLVIKDTYATKEEVSKIITAEIVVLNDIRCRDLFLKFTCNNSEIWDEELAKVGNTTEVNDGNYCNR